MTGKQVTMTSKNQITLPAAYVRSIGLGKSRRLTIRLRGDELVLKPQPTLQEHMKPVWDEMAKHVKRPLSDEELKQAIRKSVAHGAWRKEQ